MMLQPAKSISLFKVVNNMQELAFSKVVFARAIFRVEKATKYVSSIRKPLVKHVMKETGLIIRRNMSVFVSEFSVRFPV